MRRIKYNMLKYVGMIQKIKYAHYTCIRLVSKKCCIMIWLADSA